ncbi:putative transcriptional regulatory protein-like protein [Emericellopsis cladophorae]|uniref:Transcriptional regulatory protein-like protein n=1 Tax=Emericellopsis cladophorae TaxID=2686198 RepID=A0A9Q0BC93_9HYPO|nr:putative transcriptional regulatory protein-like protein [Emericellopsis cladophorae]KAI6779496.1 putative transcriptional regulatory protein-like protein [Emericellopsis cladophorae]
MSEDRAPPNDWDSDASDEDTASRVSSKRKRPPVSVSCELCKQRKVKCDRGQPSCGWCTRNGATCEYKERRKPGLRAGYGRELEQRLDKLEQILRSHSEILQASLSNQGSSTSPNHHMSSAHNNPLASSLNTISPNNNSHGNAMSHHGSLPSDNGTPRDPVFRPPEHLRTPQAETALFLHKPSSFTPASQDFGVHVAQTPGVEGFHNASISGMSAPSQMQGPVNTHSPTVPIPHVGAPAALDQEMPPYDLLYALVDLYFKHINTWCPILHRKTTLDSLFGPSTLQETDRILLHAIVATTMRYSNDGRLTEERRRHYHQVSKNRVLLYGMENASVKALQALLILALDLCGDSNGPPGWNIMALITRSVVQLGLAVEATSSSVSPNITSIYTLRAMVLPDSKDFIDEEARRRLFWMIYMLDRYATIATAFEFALDDKEIDRTLPCRDDLWIKNQKVETRWFKTKDHHDESGEYGVNKPENIGAFGFHCEILNILGQIHNFLKQPVDISALSDVEQWQMRYKELDNMLTSYKFSLPNEYGNMAKLFQPGSKNLNCGWVMLHATYHFAVIRLHSSAAYPTTRSPIFTPSYSASQRCHGAVENIAALGEFVINNGLVNKLGPPFAFTLWVAARLLLVHGSTVEHKLSPQISFFVETLREMGRYWPVAARYCELLSRVLDEHRDSEHKGDGVTPSSVKILADMRRTAFDLDFLISRQPKAGGAAGGSMNPSRLPSVTPARTPAPNELEYLDVFDFFNFPRLPAGGENIVSNGNGNNTQTPAPGDEMDPGGNGQGLANEFNITNFTVDANSDWLFKQDSMNGKFMS